MALAVAAIAVAITVAATELEPRPTDELRPDDAASGGEAQVGPPVADGPAGVFERIAAAVGPGDPGAEQADSATGSQLHLTVPPHDALLRAATPHAPPQLPAGQLRAHAYQYESRVFERPAKRPHAVGFVRRGIALAAESGGRRGPGCTGRWYRLSGGGYVCSRDGFALSRQTRPPPARQPPPRVEDALPYRYGKAETHAVLRYLRLPSAEEQREAQLALAADQQLPEFVERQMQGVFLLALDREEGQGERSFLRTARGRYVPATQVLPKPLPPMRGELLGDDNPLPIAFVYGEDAQGESSTPLLQRHGGQERVVGSADKHARFSVARTTRWDGRTVVESPGGFAVVRDRVRIAKRIARPDGVGAHDRWIHVDLDEQALIAYEGDAPVFATLVSSGKGAEFATPKGLFQVREKHISVTMSGPDPDQGYYEVEEVPWTQYYLDSFALHGAYWHDDFGKTRSHGCTNIPPVDARWLFYWTEGELPAGWHALRNLRGTHVYLTRERPPE